MTRNAAGWVTLAVVALVAASPAAWPASKTGSSGGGGWGGGTGISPVNQPDPTRGAQVADVAVNASGVAIAAWDQYTYNYSFGATIGAAVQGGGRWGSPFSFYCDGATCMNPRVAVAADGTIAVSWTAEDSYVSATAPQRRAQVAVRPAGSTTWTTTNAGDGSAGGVAIPLFVPIAFDASGNLTAAWTTLAGGYAILQTATRPATTGQWPAPTTLVSGATTYSPSLAVNAKGDVAIVYTVSSCASCYMPYVAQYVSRAKGATTWTAPVNVSEAIVPYGSGYITSPAVALDKQGLATVIYFGYGVEAVRHTSLGTATSPSTWTSPQTVLTAPTPTSSFGSFDLGLDDNGNRGRRRLDFRCNHRCRSFVGIRVQARPVGRHRRRSTSASPTPLYQSTPTRTRVAVSGDGTLAIVGWIDHYHGTVQVAQLSGGTTSGGNAWNTTTIGRGTAFSSFQEVLGLKAGSGTAARAIWKNTKSGTQWYAASYGR